MGQVPSPDLQCGRGRLCTSVDHCPIPRAHLAERRSGSGVDSCRRARLDQRPNLYRLESIHEWFPTFANIIKSMFEFRDVAIWFDDIRPSLGIKLDHESAAEWRVELASDEVMRDR